MHATRPTHARRVRPRPAAALLALITFLAPPTAPAQPLKFEATAPSAPPSDAALSVAERLEKEATGIGASTPSRAAGSALRAFAAALIRRGLTDADPPRVLLGLTLSRSTSALDTALAANADAARAAAASLAPSAENPPADLSAAEIALGDALAPLAPRAPSDVFAAHLWPTHAAPPAPDLPADVPAPIAAALAALRTPDDAPLTLRPRHERLAADARAAAAIAGKRPAWMSTAEHASFVTLLQQTLDRAASVPAQDPAPSSALERSLHALALAARATGFADALETRDARAARRGWSALFSRTLADPAASLDSWRPFAAGLADAAAPPPFRDLPAQLRTGARFFSAAAAQSRAQLVAALSRAAAEGDFQSPALLGARVAHDRRLVELSALATSAGVIAAPKKAASKSEPGVLPAFESVARRLRTTGRDLSSSTLRDVAAAQFRDLTRGLSLFHPSAAELALRSIAGGTEPAPPALGDAPNAPPESEAAVRRALAALSAGRAPAILATLDAARAAWLKSWESERTAPGRPREQRDPAELQRARDAAAERLARIAEALDFLYLAAWASASSSPDSLAAPRLTSFPAWDLSPKAAEWIAGELQPAAADVVLTLGEARPEALAASLDQARLRAAPALLAGSLARLLLRSGADPTPRTDLSVVLAELAAGPPPPDAVLLAHRADLASICVALEEAAALASKGKASDAEAALKPARALALSLLDAEEFRSQRN